ncbi:Tlg2-vesicle protein [Tulasnella sp. 403]|nr:Tlg2-vesicle protein [Tulasnella sp. 403]
MRNWFRKKDAPNKSSTTAQSSVYLLPSEDMNATLPMHKLPDGSTLAPPRTPSPTPSDIEELKKGLIDWKAAANWRNWAKRKYIVYYVIGIVSIVIVSLVSIYHHQIVDWLAPGSKFLKTLPGGWSIPIGVMFVLSFPPLFGNEIVHVLCGIVWGLWIGFGIVCAGTFLGEVGNFYAFRYCCQSRGDKLEKSSLFYACLAKVVREGGFLVALIIRLSAIPGHFTTAVFSTCGMGIWTFCLGAFLSLPKQFATVYIGVVLYESAGVQTTQQKVISGAVLALTIGITIYAAWWIMQKMAQAKPAVLAERRKAKAIAAYNAKLYSLSQSDLESSVNIHGAPKATPSSFVNGPASVTASSSSTLVPSTYSQGFTSSGFQRPFNHDGSEVNLPLSVKPQRWDDHGRAILDYDYRMQYNKTGPQEERNPRPPISGAGPPAVPGSQPPPPDIRIIRASGASTIAPYDVPLTTPTQARASQGFSRPMRPPTGQRPESPGSEDGSGENAPQWAAGMTREDEMEVTSPLTANVRESGSRSRPMANLAQRQQSVPSPIAPPSGPSRDYNDLDLYNPYERTEVTNPPARGHGWEATESTVASYHTAEGSMSNAVRPPAMRSPSQSPPSRSPTSRSPPPPHAYAGSPRRARSPPGAFPSYNH